MMICYALLNLSIIAATVIAAARFKVLGAAMRSFLFLTWLALANEILSLVLMYTIKNNTVNANIYTLAEYLLLVLQYRYWLGGKAGPFIWLAAAGCLMWVMDNLLWHSIHNNNSAFRAAYALAIVLLGIRKMNRLIIDSPRPVFKEAVFLICAGLVFYSGCRAFMEIFNLFSIGFSLDFEIRLFWALSAVNCIINITYAIALLCIPAKNNIPGPRTGRPYPAADPRLLAGPHG